MGALGRPPGSGGFVGNFVLRLADHAQNGFFHAAEWVAVGSAAFAVGALVAVLLVYHNRPLIRLCAVLMLVQMVVGLLGSYFHGVGNLENPAGTLWEKFLYDAPIFAPLLFANLAILAMLALWALWTVEPEGGEPQAR